MERSPSDRPHRVACRHVVCRGAPSSPGVIRFLQAFELVFAIILVAGVFVLSGSRTAVAAILVSLVMATVAAIFRLKAPSILAINLFAGAWLITGITLGCVVAPAVFGSGPVSYPPGICPILLHLAIRLTFLALFTFTGSLVPNGI